MASKKKYFWVLIIFLTTIIFVSCSDNKKARTDTFYIELVNFNNDTLKKEVAGNIFGKVSFYRNNKLELLSSNYVIEGFPDMHAYQDVKLLDKKVKPGTRKIKVEFVGSYTADSIKYALQKYVYKEDSWVKTSDMGIIRYTNSYSRPLRFAIIEFGKQIVVNIVDYTYN